MFHFEVKKTLLKGDGTYPGTGTVPPLYELILIGGNLTQQIYIQNFTTVAAAKAAAVALLAAGTTITWTDNNAVAASSTWSYSNDIARPASA
jgi:adenosylcobinamide amidohydrolase